METTPDQSLQGEYEVRVQKRKELLSAGVIPYANQFSRTHTIPELYARSQEINLPPGDILLESGGANSYSTAGRMMTFRTHGKLSFATIRDAAGDIQIAFAKNLCVFNTGREVVSSLSIGGIEISAYKLIEKYFDLGDFIGVKGELFITNHGELTLFVNEFQMLSKALRPLGDKWHGLQDEELKYRKRYLDLTMNEDTYKRFLFKTKFYQALRAFYVQEGFQEIVTPILGNSASGAAAKPFQTYHNDYDLDVYLRIAFEVGLKMATVGRYEKVFEIGKDFRNEGSDPSHLQEFTQTEHYAAYWNYEDNMRFAEKMFDFLFKECDLPNVLTIQDKHGVDKEINRSTPWERIDYIAGVNSASGIQIEQYGPDDATQLRADIQAAGHSWAGMESQSVPTLIDYLYKKVLRPSIVGPAFVYNYPKTMQPLARQSDANPSIVEQFQVVVNGWEIIKAYSELVDPVVQEENFNQQMDAHAQGDEEATVTDDEFLMAMQHGMPPQSGFGMGLERIIALLTNQSNLRDVVLFPLMKPISDSSDTTRNEKESNRIDKKHDEQAPPTPTHSSIDGLLDQYLTTTKLHCKQVGAVMRDFATKLGYDPHYRYAVGVLHDIDRDHIDKDPAAHVSEQFEAIMNEAGIDQQIIDDIKSHYHERNMPLDTPIRKYLRAVDELTGFVHAVSLVRPNGYEGMKRKSVKKKIADKGFAAAIDRDELREGEALTGQSLQELTESIILTLQTNDLTA